jgi:hypothetical protein
VARRNRRRRLRTRRVDTVPSSRPVQIHVTFTPGQLVWLLTGIGIGQLRLLDEINLLVRGLVSG